MTKKKKVSVEDQERAQAKTEYEKRLADVMKLKAMSDTDAWQETYRWIRTRIEQHSQDILIADKPRDVIAHQEGVKVLRNFISEVKKPVEAFSDYFLRMPLFAPTVRIRAEWNEVVGKVELRDLDPKSKTEKEKEK